MIALFVLLQLAAAATKDIIIEDKSKNTFERIESGQCITGSPDASVEYKFSSDKVTVLVCNKAECTGTCYEGTGKIPNGQKLETQDCPKYVGFTINDGTKDCKYESTGDRTYYKEGCFNNNTKHVVKNNKLVTETYNGAGCSGTVNKTVEIGECHKCNQFTEGSTIKYAKFVQCGDISKMILVLLALVFFLF